MSETREQRLTEVVTSLARRFSCELDRMAIASYCQALGRMSDQQLMDAYRLAIERFRFMPAADEIRALVGVSDRQLAESAWQILLHAINEVGSANPVAFDDPRMVHAIRRTWGDWVRLCTEVPEEPGYELNRQRELFIQYFTTAPEDVHKPWQFGGRLLNPGTKPRLITTAQHEYRLIEGAGSEQ